MGGFLKVFRVQNGKFVLVMSQGINFVVTSQRIFHFVLKLKIGDETRDIPYGKGVKQGDVMAPILFLFLMLAFSETLEQEYEQEWDIKPIEFKYHANIRDGQQKYQPLNVRALTIKLIQLLYVDDTFFPFATREDLVKGSNLIFDLFK
jgi:hypothetical protein